MCKEDVRLGRALQYRSTLYQSPAGVVVGAVRPDGTRIGVIMVADPRMFLAAGEGVSLNTDVAGIPSPVMSVGLNVYVASMNVTTHGLLVTQGFDLQSSQTGGTNLTIIETFLVTPLKDV